MLKRNKFIFICFGVTLIIFYVLIQVNFFSKKDNIETVDTTKIDTKTYEINEENQEEEIRKPKKKKKPKLIDDLYEPEDVEIEDTDYPLVFTVSSHNLELAKNCFESLRRIGEDNYLVFALDDAAYNEIKKITDNVRDDVLKLVKKKCGKNCFSKSSDTSVWYSNNWAKIIQYKFMWLRFNHKYHFYERGAIYSDVDISYIKPFRKKVYEHIYSRRSTHITYMNDQHVTTSINTGFIIMKKLDIYSFQIMTSLLDVHHFVKIKGDQALTQQVLDYYVVEYYLEYYSLLDYKYFTSGQKGVYDTSVMYHPNYVRGGQKAKIEKLKKNKCWYL